MQRVGLSKEMIPEVKAGICGCCWGLGPRPEHKGLQEDLRGFILCLGMNVW